MVAPRLLYPLAIAFLIFSTHLACAQAPDAEAFIQMGHKKKHGGDLEGAIEFYKKSLEVDPNFDAAQSSLTHAIDEKNLRQFAKNFPEACQTKTPDFDRTLECAQKYFLMNGRPINPMIIKDLTTELSDRGDQIVAINLLDSQESNKYFCERYIAQKHEKYFLAEVVETSQENTSFRYSIEGITEGGVYILKITEQTGGSGIFSSLMFVRIHKGMGLGETDNNRLVLNKKRILIEKLGEFPLGDRVKSMITVQGNAVLIETEEYLPPYQKSTKKIMISLE